MEAKANVNGVDSLVVEDEVCMDGLVRLPSVCQNVARGQTRGASSVRACLYFGC